MKPSEAGFDGDKGIIISDPGNMYPYGLTYRLKRGTKKPGDYPEKNFKNQLIWFCPENKEPTLLFCNDLEEWFQLEFSPISLDSLYP